MTWEHILVLWGTAGDLSGRSQPLNEALRKEAPDVITWNGCKLDAFNYLKTVHTFLSQCSVAAEGQMVLLIFPRSFLVSLTKNQVFIASGCIKGEKTPTSGEMGRRWSSTAYHKVYKFIIEIIQYLH